MQLSEIEREQLYAIVEKYDHHPDVQRMREYIQHGSVTTYQHCKNVALVSFWLNRRLHLHADETSLAVGALLHDFYLYDWHTTGTFHGLRRLFEMHGFSHPGYACVNAKRVELYYEVGVGLMAVEPGAVESGTIYSPYTRELYDNAKV